MWENDDIVSIWNNVEKRLLGTMMIDSSKQTVIFSSRQKFRADLIVGFLLLQVSLTSLQNCLLLARQPFRHFYGQVELLTAYLIQPTLLFNILVFFVIVYGLLIKLGGMNISQLGFKIEQLISGLLILIILWILTQFLIVSVNIFTNVPNVLNPAEHGNGVPFMIGSLLAQVFGNALVEELCFRGFLFVQCILLFKKYFQKRELFAVFFGFLISQLVFSLIHIPSRMQHSTDFYFLLNATLETWVFGLFFASIYWRTRNLFIAVAIHSLINTPTPLFVGGNDPKIYILSLTLVGLIFWPKIIRTRFGS